MVCMVVLCVYHVCAGTQPGQKRETDVLELECLAVLSHLMQTLGTKFESGREQVNLVPEENKFKKK